jgi:hypothetical protein
VNRSGENSAARAGAAASADGGARRRAAKIVLAVGVGAALAVGAGAAAYGVWRQSMSKPASVTAPDNNRLGGAAAAKVVGLPAGQFRPGFKHARSIAVSPAGEVYVSGDMAIRRFDSGGRMLSEIETAEQADALAVDEAGNIYATMGDKVWVFDASGKRAAAWPARAGALFTSIAICEAGVLVADAGGRCILRYDGGGKVVGVIGRRDEARRAPGLVVPSPYFDVAMAPDGLIRIVNPGRHRIEAYTLAGDREAAWGHFSGVEASGFVGCCNPSNFAVVPTAGQEAGASKHGGFAGFVTAEKGLARVKVFDEDGKFVGLLAPADEFKKHDELVAARPSGQPFEALDVAAGPDGLIYVLDGAVGQVRVYQWRKTERPRAARPYGEGAERAAPANAQ